ncbi:hypothetical protein [Nannocystis punicea]|uniref:Uncharacterized protein n=1 Tax=Nannocystis punicea TaxID=2995304 RepID=A0ABY7HDW2_9BACT|nr:hypothetical protein [Nannocystis poenicansa]WAS97467.1 hypothetical protein O0S08_15075 [Nannocystis poenicansa]
MWLWLSFQRYALLLALVAASPLALTWWQMPAAWWAWSLAAVVALRIGAVAVAVGGRWPRKLRALRVATRRIELGRFAPADVRRYCGDPCFRVVAREALRRAGVPAAEARRLVRAYARELRIEASELVVVDHVGGQIRRVSAGQSTVLSLPPPPASVLSPDHP